LNYFPVSERVTLHFFLSGDGAPEVRVFGFNEDEDVQVVRPLAKARWNGPYDDERPKTRAVRIFCDDLSHSRL